MFRGRNLVNGCPLQISCHLIFAAILDKLVHINSLLCLIWVLILYLIRFKIYFLLFNKLFADFVWLLIILQLLGLWWYFWLVHLFWLQKLSFIQNQVQFGAYLVKFCFRYQLCWLFLNCWWFQLLKIVFLCWHLLRLFLLFPPNSFKRLPHSCWRGSCRRFIFIRKS